jgi:beta-lactam-binding protein with PASTA domain
MKKPVLVVCVALALAGCRHEQPGTTSTGTTSAAPAKQWSMPNLVGSNLQKAQDAMQKLTGNPVFITTSHDATGQRRNQVVDSNWKVCSQSISPGATVTPDSKVDFGAVKEAEPCP